MFFALVAPAVFGLIFIYVIDIFTVDQIIAVLTSPPVPLFVVAATGIALFYFFQFARPIATYLDNPTDFDTDIIRKKLAQFSLHYWALFLSYLLIAPAVTIISAEHYTNFSAAPIDWFRVHLVALIVSIIIGLPLFFQLFDLLGKAFGGVVLQKPIFTIKLRIHRHREVKRTVHKRGRRFAGFDGDGPDKLRNNYRHGWVLAYLLINLRI